MVAKRTVSPEKQARAAALKAKAQALVDVSHVPGAPEAPKAFTPPTPQQELRGGKGAALIEVGEVRKAILGAYASGLTIARPTRDAQAQAIVKGLFAVFSNAPQEAVSKALSVKDVPIQTTDYVRLQEAKAFHKAWQNGLADVLLADVVAWTSASGEEKSGFSLKDRRDAARALVRDKSSETKLTAMRADVESTLIAAGISPEEAASKAGEVAAARIAAAVKERKVPTVDDKALSYAKRLIKDNGLEYALKFASALTVIVGAACREQDKLNALMHGSEIKAARKTA